jgi:DME family drug/metabolite transporter
VPAATDPRAPFYVVAAATLWGTTGTAQALGPDGASSIAVGATRNVVGAAVLVAVAALRRRLVAGVRELERRPLVLAALATAAYQLCFFGGVGWPGWPSAPSWASAPGRCGAGWSGGSVEANAPDGGGPSPRSWR